MFAPKRCSAVVLLDVRQQALNSSHVRHSFRLRCSRVICYSDNTRRKADRDEKSDERVTICAFVPPRGHAQQRQQTQMLSSGDGWTGPVRYHCSHTVKTTGRGRSAPLAAACVCVYTGLQALSAVRASPLGRNTCFP